MKPDAYQRIVSVPVPLRTTPVFSYCRFWLIISVYWSHWWKYLIQRQAVQQNQACTSWLRVLTHWPFQYSWLYNTSQASCSAEVISSLQPRLIPRPVPDLLRSLFLQSDRTLSTLSSELRCVTVCKWVYTEGHPNMQFPTASIFRSFEHLWITHPGWCLMRIRLASLLPCLKLIYY